MLHFEIYMLLLHRGFTLTQCSGGERKEPWFLTSLALDSFIMYRSLALLASLHLLDLMSGVTPFSSRSLSDPFVL